MLFPFIRAATTIRPKEARCQMAFPRIISFRGLFLCSVLHTHNPSHSLPLAMRRLHIPVRGVRHCDASHVRRAGSSLRFDSRARAETRSTAGGASLVSTDIFSGSRRYSLGAQTSQVLGRHEDAKVSRDSASNPEQNNVRLLVPDKASDIEDATSTVLGSSDMLNILIGNDVKSFSPLFLRDSCR